MGSKLQKSRQAAAEFFKTANPADEFFLVQFNDRPELTRSLYDRYRQNPEHADVYAIERTNGAAGQRVSCHARDEEGA